RSVLARRADVRAAGRALTVRQRDRPAHARARARAARAARRRDRARRADRAGRADRAAAREGSAAAAAARAGGPAAPPARGREDGVAALSPPLTPRPPTLRERARGAPAELDALVARLLEKDRATITIDHRPEGTSPLTKPLAIAAGGTPSRSPRTPRVPR